MASDIKAVIFDYGGVLSLHPGPEAFSEMRRILGVDEARFGEIYWELRNDYDRGVVDGPRYWRQFAERAGARVSAQDVNRLIEGDNEAWSAINESVLKWVRGLQDAGTRTALLSNMPSDLMGHLLGRFEWLGSFSALTFSCAVGKVKPETGIYTHCLDSLGFSPENTLFIDDRQVNVEAARGLGMHAIVFRSIEQLLDPNAPHARWLKTVTPGKSTRA